MKTDALRQMIEALAPTDGSWETEIEGLQLFRLSHPVRRAPSVYTPSVCVLVSGQKLVFLGDQVHTYDCNHYFCCATTMPVEAATQKASKEHPVLGMMLSFETKAFQEAAIETEVASATAFPTTGSECLPGLAVIERDSQFDEAIFKLLQLTGDKSALSILGNGRLREVYYALLISGAGPMIRQTYGVNNGIAESIRYMRENLNVAISIEEMARRAGMSRAAFHRKFKEATTLAPLQFVKNLRLYGAAKSMATGMPVSRAAVHSGHSSASQFSREFKRRFETSPRDWLGDRTALLEV